MQGELSLPAQERIIRAALAETGQGVYRVYRDILSGTRPDRADYQQMLADARAGKLTMVAFHKVNRFGRDVAEGLAAVNELRRLGVKIRIADLPTLDIEKPEGMLIFTILLGQGQYEVENLGSEAIKGMREMVLAGGWPFSAPDGYQNCREYLNSHRRRCWVAVDRKRAAIIRLIYRWYARGTITIRDIANRLNRLHDQRAAQGKTGCLTCTGKRWGVQHLWIVLTNPFYAGVVEVPSWDIRVRGAHAAIIPSATVARVQTVLAAHRNGPLIQHVYLLQGRVGMHVQGEHVTLYCSTATQRNIRSYYRIVGGRRQYFNANTMHRAVLIALRQRIATLGPDPQVAIAQRMRQALAAAQVQRGTVAYAACISLRRQASAPCLLISPSPCRPRPEYNGGHAAAPRHPQPTCRAVCARRARYGLSALFH